MITAAEARSKMSVVNDEVVDAIVRESLKYIDQNIRDRSAQGYSSYKHYVKGLYLLKIKERAAKKIKNELLKHGYTVATHRDEDYGFYVIDIRW